MIEFLLALAASGFLLSVAVTYFAVRTAGRVRVLQEHLARLSRSSPDSLTKRVDSITEQLAELATELETLAHRYKMSKVRAAALHAEKNQSRETAEPNPHTDPDGWRNWMNDKLARARLGA